MDVPESGAPGPPGQKSHDPRDGAINFAGYSDPQLRELRYTIDQDRFPQNFANLLAEIDGRARSSTDPATESESVLGRFSRRDGLPGWFESKVNRSPVYGTGSVESSPGMLLLNGWQRTWLGTPLQVQVAFPSSCIWNVATDGDLVRFEIRRAYLPAKRVVFSPASPTSTRHLVSRLPQTMTPGFERRWDAIRDFNARLRQVARRPVVSSVLVTANVLMFLLMAFATKSLSQFSPAQIISWGSNFGPLTVNGQWWRLLTSIFVHLDPMHLLLNMWALWSIGRLAEQLFGRWTFAFLYFASGLLASLASIAWNPDVNTAGASGAIFGTLGAFISFFLNRRNHVPASIARRHWIGTGAFVIFNLVSGTLQPGIDNAAHVGGLLEGFVLGWIVARPLELSGRRPVSTQQGVLAIVLLVLSAGAALWQVKGLGSQLTPPEQFYRTHSDLMSTESANLKRWNELAQRATAGAISDSELSERFERDIIPFWQAARVQLEKEYQSSQRPAGTYLSLVLNSITTRETWAERLVDVLRHPQSNSLAEITDVASKANAAQARLERIQLRAAMDHRPRALVNNPAIVAFRRLFTGHRWSCVEAPSYVPTPTTTDDKNDGPAMRHALGCLAQQLFMSGDYQQLNSLLSHHSQTLGDLPDGTSSYEGLLGGLSDLFNNSGIDAPKFLERTSDWRRSDHTSSTPDMLEALIFEASAWSIRGHGSADSVNAQQWAIFAYRAEMAAAALEDTAGARVSNPMWYSFALEIGLDRNLDVDHLRATFDEGYARFPKFRTLERRMMRVLMPRWRGSYDEVDRFIDNLYEPTARERGFERYAELYTEYAYLEDDSLDLFSATKAFWSGMRSGYLGLVKRYPKSDVVLNIFASMACRAGDGDQYGALRESLANRYSSVAWSSTYSLNSCDAQFASETASHAHDATLRSTSQGSETLESFGGVRLGISPTDLFEIKGTPLGKPYEHWSYSIGEPPHHGLLTAVFSPKTDTSEPKLISIEFTGDEAAAPTELPYLNGSSENDLKDRFGYLIGMGSPAEGVTRYNFKNGVYADARNGKVFRYGIYARDTARQ